KPEPGAPVASVPMQRAAAATPTVPNTTAVKAGSSFDVAALSAQPGKGDATTQPTSQPISAVVSDRAQGLGSRAQGADGSDSAASPAAPATAKRPRKGKVAQDEDALPARAAVPTADGETSLVRA